MERSFIMIIWLLNRHSVTSHERPLRTTFDLAHNYTTGVFSTAAMAVMAAQVRWHTSLLPVDCSRFSCHLRLLSLSLSPSPTLPLSCQCCSWRKADTWYSEDSSFCLRDLISGSAPTAEERGREGGVVVVVVGWQERGKEREMEAETVYV